MKMYDFTCPDCGGHELKQIESVYVGYHIDSIGETVCGIDVVVDTDIIPCDDTESGYALAYDCCDCEYRLMVDGSPVSTEQGLVDWLKTHSVK